MKKLITYLFAFFIVQSSFTQTFRIVGYLPTYRWSYVSDINFNELTHVCASFANPDENGNFSFSEDLSILVNNAHEKNRKVLISIGGGGLSENISNTYKTLTTSTNRAAFINKLMNFVRTNNLDGVDVDLEGSLVQMSTYNAYVVQLADSVHAEGLEISAALATWTNSYVNTATANALDFLNLMSYDQTGPWLPNNPGQHSSYNNAVSDFNYWKNRGQAADKIVLGVPFYGYDFKTVGTADALSWCEIVGLYPNNINDDQATTPGGTVYYNGKTTIKNKTQFMLDQKGGGIMIWELAQDCYGIYSLFNVITETKNTANSVISINDNPTLTIYPNPVENDLILSQAVEGTYQIFDINGKVLLNGVINGSSIDVQDLTSGAYILQLMNGQQSISKKFVK